MNSTVTAVRRPLLAPITFCRMSELRRMVPIAPDDTTINDGTTMAATSTITTTSTRHHVSETPRDLIGASSVPVITVRRSLFGPIDHDENRRFVNQELQKIADEETRKYNFDFKEDRPLDGIYQWTETSHVPVAYKMRHLQAESVAATKCLESFHREVQSTATLRSVITSSAAHASGTQNITVHASGAQNTATHLSGAQSITTHASGEQSIATHASGAQGITQTRTKKSRAIKPPTSGGNAKRTLNFANEDAASSSTFNNNVDEVRLGNAVPVDGNSSFDGNQSSIDDNRPHDGNTSFSAIKTSFIVDNPSFNDTNASCPSNIEDSSGNCDRLQPECSNTHDAVSAAAAVTPAPLERPPTTHTKQTSMIDYLRHRKRPLSSTGEPVTSPDHVHKKPRPAHAE
ncbi:uncharacterized protein LOC108678689 [Hyalella azteca]|uniref:Uncharacterized protein LOC108678689 n=1 Tax=Hyalella azteca TaxID=294128 RepID=A0A8B7P9A6_HYAAZ|nr:uncharacterized protein LOC108678689 [Hyalella azteca]